MNSPTSIVASHQPSTPSEEALFIDHANIKKGAMVLRAINHTLRNELITIIHNNPGITVTEIYVKLRLEQSVASQHLAILRRAGILVTQKTGKFIFYTVNYEHIKKINEYTKAILTYKK